MIVITAMSSVRLRMAFNNDILKFYSNDSSNPASFADLEIANSGGVTPDVTLRLYPGPDGKFFCNLKPYASALINTRNFEDTLETDLGGIDVSAYLYDFTFGTILKKSITILVPGSSFTTNYMWLTGVEQLEDFNSFDKRDFYVLSPCDKLTNNHSHLKYWQGYPFDVSLFYGDNVVGSVNNYNIKNNTNLLDMNFTIDKAGNFNLAGRLVFSDGRTDETIEDVLPLVDGFNKLTWSKVGDDPENNKYITVEKIPYRCGAYFKWLNKYGGYSYWLFENTYSFDRTIKQIGELDRDNSNLEDTFTRSIQMGKESQDTIKVIAELINPDERKILEGIIDSPKIYMFTGQPLARNSYRNWIEVNLKTSSSRIKNPKQQLVNFAFEFELPQRYTQTL